jgi:hypothetical protein
MCNDTHDCSVQTGDAWLRSWVPKITATADYKAGNTALFIVYDEYTPIPTVFMSASVKPGTASNQAFSHYSLLRTTEEMLGIPNYLEKASSAPSMRATYNL